MIDARTFLFSDRTLLDGTKSGNFLKYINDELMQLNDAVSQLMTTATAIPSPIGLSSYTVPVDLIGNGYVTYAQHIMYYIDYEWTSDSVTNISRDPIPDKGTFTTGERGHNPYKGKQMDGVPNELQQFEQALAKLSTCLDSTGKLDGSIFGSRQVKIGGKLQTFDKWMSDFNAKPYKVKMNNGSSHAYSEITHVWPTISGLNVKVKNVANATAPLKADLDGTGDDEVIKVAVTTSWIPNEQINVWTMESDVPGLGKDNYIKGALTSAVVALTKAGITAGGKVLGLPGAVTKVANIGVSAVVNLGLNDAWDDLIVSDPETLNSGGRVPEEGGLDSFEPTVSVPGDVLYTGYRYREKGSGFTGKFSFSEANTAINIENFRFGNAGLRSVTQSRRQAPVVDRFTKRLKVQYRRMYCFSNIAIGKTSGKDIKGDDLEITTVATIPASVINPPQRIAYVTGS
jgi:hypothetical protein